MRATCHHSYDYCPIGKTSPPERGPRRVLQRLQRVKGLLRPDRAKEKGRWIGGPKGAREGNAPLADYDHPMHIGMNGADVVIGSRVVKRESELIATVQRR